MTGETVRELGWDRVGGTAHGVVCAKGDLKAGSTTHKNAMRYYKASLVNAGLGIRRR